VRERNRPGEIQNRRGNVGNVAQPGLIEGTSDPDADEG
jgi:hypothetical protein